VCLNVDLEITLERAGRNTGVPEVGVEIVKPARNFWHIAFPPADWSPRGPESKIYGPQVVANLGKGQKP